MSTGNLLDLDAAKREIAHPEGIRIKLNGEEYLLPAELPLDVFDPFLDDNLDLIGIVRDFMSAREESDENDTSEWLAALLGRPNLPRQVLDSLHAALGLLFGADDYARFRASRPAVSDYGRLITGLVKLYSVGLGEAFGSQNSSGKKEDGETAKPISNVTTTDSTLGNAIDPRMPAQVTSESADSSVSSDASLPTPA